MHRLAGTAVDAAKAHHAVVTKNRGLALLIEPDIADGTMVHAPGASTAFFVDGNLS